MLIRDGVRSFGLLKRYLFHWFLIRLCIDDLSLRLHLGQDYEALVEGSYGLKTFCQLFLFFLFPSRCSFLKLGAVAEGL